MGITYHGPYADQIGYETHEGYVAHVLDDGTLTGTYSAETRSRMIGAVMAACDCGWTGQHRYASPTPADENAENEALAEWDDEHLQPMIRAIAARQTIPATALLDLATDLRSRADAEYRDGGDNALTPRGRGLYDAADEIHRLLNQQAR